LNSFPILRDNGTAADGDQPLPHAVFSDRSHSFPMFRDNGNSNTDLQIRRANSLPATPQRSRTVANRLNHVRERLNRVRQIIVQREERQLWYKSVKNRIGIFMILQLLVLLVIAATVECKFNKRNKYICHVGGNASISSTMSGEYTKPIAIISTIINSFLLFLNTHFEFTIVDNLQLVPIRNSVHFVSVCASAIIFFLLVWVDSYYHNDDHNKLAALYFSLAMFSHSSKLEMYRHFRNNMYQGQLIVNKSRRVIAILVMMILSACGCGLSFFFDHTTYGTYFSINEYIFALASIASNWLTWPMFSDMMTFSTLRDELQALGTQA
jgi:hypothetical protein